jgi:hypothetical protein
MIIGIDIGSRGGLALLNPQGELIEVANMPILRDGPKGRPAVNAPILADLVFRWHASHAFVEHVGARPGEGAVGAFAFGRSRGVVEGVLGRTYSSTPGNIVDVLDADAQELQANGWVWISASGPSTTRPTGTLGLYSAAAGQWYYDVTIGKLIVSDGQTWRDPSNGNAV